MTDRIDLDDLETEEPTAERPNHGDWFWRGEGDPDDEGPPADDDERDSLDADDTDGRESEPESNRVPHVPRETKDRPVGIPKASGGAGAGAGVTDQPDGRTDDGADVPTSAEGATGEAVGASGPHGGDADDMTMALTYAAARRLEHPRRVLGDAGGWTDWIGVVGDVPAHVVQKFQREHGFDADFFSGSGTGPAERLVEIDRHSMFYADRMVVVGIADADEPIADAADWEFVPLETAAEKADWTLDSSP